LHRARGGFSFLRFGVHRGQGKLFVSGCFVLAGFAAVS
jgi:hypothetical protein